jgi:hypothetical protein
MVVPYLKARQPSVLDSLRLFASGAAEGTALVALLQAAAQALTPTDFIQWMTRTSNQSPPDLVRWGWGKGWDRGCRLSERQVEIGAWSGAEVRVGIELWVRLCWRLDEKAHLRLAASGTHIVRERALSRMARLL